MPATHIEEEEIPEPRILERQKMWMQEVNRMLIGYKNYDPDRKLIKKFLNERLDFKLYCMYGYQLIWDIMKNFQAGVTQKRREFCVDYMLIIKKVYMMLSERNKLVFHKKFFEEWQHHSIDYCPYFETLLIDFSDNLDDILAEIEKDVENINEDLKEELRFNIMVSPVTTILRIFAHATRRKQLIQFAIDICHQVPALFYDRELSIWHTEYEPDQKEPILAVVLRRLLFNCRLEEPTEGQYDDFELLSIHAITGETPLLSPWILLDMVLCELYTKNRIPTKSLEVLAGIASRVLSPMNVAIFDWKFATSIRAQPEKKTFLVPSIIVMILDLMTEYHENKRSYEILESCKAILQGFGNRMREENEEFDEETKGYLMCKIRDMPWWIEYAMSTWFWALDVQRRRIPSVIFTAAVEAEEYNEKTNRRKVKEEPRSSNSDSSEEQETVIEYPKKRDKFAYKYEPIDFDDKNGTASREELYVRAIMELGLFDVECCLELLHIKTLIKFEDANKLCGYMEKTMHECFGVSMGHNGREDSRVLFMEILEVYDKRWSEQDHEYVANEIVNRARVPVVVDNSLLCTNEIKRSVIIPALMSPAKERAHWPPEDSNFIQMSRREIRQMQKLERERLLREALEKSTAIAQHHRETWANREVKPWACPQSPPNEPSFFDSDQYSQSSFYAPSEHSDHSTTVTNGNYDDDVVGYSPNDSFDDCDIKCSRV